MKEPEIHKKMNENQSKDNIHHTEEIAGNISGNKYKSEDERLRTVFNLNDFLLGKEITRLHENDDIVSLHHPTQTTSTERSNDQKIDTPICLLVEDCTAVAKAMMNCIKRQNWQVSLAQDGKTALELLKSRIWDVVFMDDQLPILSGSTCVVNFRDWEKGNRMSRQNNLFLCSADAHRDDALSLQGFDGILCKPLHMPKLISILKKCSIDRNVI
jgi:CheY-like chemotaxis protein